MNNKSKTIWTRDEMAENIASAIRRMSSKELCKHANSIFDTSFDVNSDGEIEETELTIYKVM